MSELAERTSGVSELAERTSGVSELAERTSGVSEIAERTSDTSELASTSVRLRLDLGYDGADFSGWAVQPGRRTVAGELTAALSRLFSDARNLTVAGRTDAGVHATGQVCHIDVPQNEWPRLAGSIVHRLAGLLPLDVRVYRVAEAPATFDARFSALSRRYEYRVTDAVYGAEPLRRHDTAAWPRTLDLDALNTAATGLVGKHDFAAFCRRREHATTIRVISRIGWRRGPDGVYVATVEADAFCQSMVRSLVGAQLYVGDGRRPPAWPASLLTMRERSGEVSVAPAHGLTLVEVCYPADAADLERRAVMTRRRRDELDPPRDELSRLRDDSHGPGR